ncbi:MAG: alpha/beta hydrolase, partial [[Clostridium] leptum]
FNLTGDQEPSASNDAYSLELHVSPETPPTFLWHTYDDEAVPAENTLLMAQALRAAKVPMEMHLYAHGPHGRSICTSAIGQFDPHTGTWFPLAVEWLDSLGLGGSLNT